MNKEEIIKYCLTLENTYKDCPFPDDFESVTMKHCKNKKWFALIMNVNNKLYLNVKTDSNYSDILRNTYELYNTSLSYEQRTLEYNYCG